MPARRTGDIRNILVLPTRSMRFALENNKWVFKTREGFSFGPYDNYHDAEDGLNDYLTFIRHASPTTLARFYQVQHQRTVHDIHQECFFPSAWGKV